MTSGRDIWRSKLCRSMRIILFVLFAAVSQVFATDLYSQSTRLSLDMKNTEIKDVLQVIESRTPFFFMYNAAQVDVTNKVNIQCENMSVPEILDVLFRDTNVAFDINNRQIALTVVESSSSQQARKVSGRVTDSSGSPLPGVTIVIKGTTQGLVTDSDGKYSISNIPKNAILQFSFVGMKLQEIAVGSQTSIDVKMIEETIGIEEVVAVGYGTMSREKITTSITKFDTEVLKNVPFSNLGTALQGTVSGLRVAQSDGQPGSNPTIVIRGGTSLTNPDGSAPLYIVDGVVRPRLTDLNQNEIESMEILKDAAATSIYGAKGANGVVLITTKSAKAGKFELTYSTNLTVSTPTMVYDFLPAKDWLYYVRTGIAASAAIYNPKLLDNLSGAWAFGTGNDLTNNTFYSTQYLNSENQHKLKEGWQSMADPLDPSKTIIFDEYDYYDLLFRNALSQNHSLMASGGNEMATFNIILGYEDDEGLVKISGYKRYNANFSGSIKVNEKVKINARVMYSNSSQERDREYEYSFKRVEAPTAKVYFEDGTLSQGYSTNLGNPLYRYTIYDQDNEEDNTTFSVGGRWDILQGLAFEPQFSLYLIQAHSRYFEKAHYSGLNYNNERYAEADFSKIAQPQADLVLSYKKDLNKHHFDARVGYSYYSQTYNYLYGRGIGATSDFIPTLNAITVMKRIKGTVDEVAYMGYFGRFNYDYNNKYLVTLTGRYDGASQLGKDRRWGLFPGVSIGWNLHNEEFWTLANLLNVKLRGSYGVNGNISGIGSYAAKGAYSIGTQYAGNGTFINTEMVNDALSWERSKTFNIGADIGLFDKRVTMMIDVYHRETDDLLANMTLPPSTGWSSIYTNLASMQNNGFDFELSANILPVTSAVQWNFAFNAAYVKNKILKLPDNGVENNRIGGELVWDPKAKKEVWKGGLQEGGKMGDMYAYKQVSIYQTDAEAAAGPVDMLVLGDDKTKYAGSVNWLDVDGNNIINSLDRVYMGNQYPNFYGGFSNSFSYKNFNLVVRADYMTGHTKINNTRAWFLTCAQGQNHLITEVYKSWQKEGDKTDIPKFYYADQNQLNINRGSSLIYEKADYLALREITLGYTFPKSLLKNVVSGLSINVTGSNLYYFTKANGTSTEVGGEDNGDYPLPRNFTFGAKITL
jgi:TonB-linked SusC/RagA family outer membrane protein